MPKSRQSAGEAIDLAAVRLMLTVAQEGSFGRAAKRLGVQTSNVTRSIKVLEDRIGVGLFQRDRGGAKLTAAGEQFAARGRRLLADAAALANVASRAGTVESGRLRIGVVASIASGFAHDLLSAYLTEHPGVVVEIEESGPDSHMADVRSVKLDAAFLTGMPLAAGCKVERLWHDKVYAALPVTHRLAGAAEVFWSQLEGERFIVSEVDPGPEIQDYIVRGLGEVGKALRIGQLKVQRETLMALVGLGQGVSLVAGAEAGVAYPGVVFRPLDSEEIPFSLVWSERNDNPALRRFLVTARRLAAERGSIRPAA